MGKALQINSVSGVHLLLHIKVTCLWLEFSVRGSHSITYFFTVPTGKMLHSICGLLNLDCQIAGSPYEFDPPYGRQSLDLSGLLNLMQQTERSWLTVWLVCKYLINAIIYRVEFVWGIILHQPIQDNEYVWLAYFVCVLSQFFITHSFDSWVLGCVHLISITYSFPDY